MSIFTLEEVPQIKGNIKFFFLYKNGECQYKQFEEQIIKEGNLKSQLNTLYARMQEMALIGNTLPEKKCRNITPKKDKIKEYELKTSDLRLYLFHDEHRGRIIVLGAKKHPKKQQRDINHFRNIKHEYLKYYDK